MKENNKAKIERLCRKGKEKTKARHRLRFPSESLHNHLRLQQDVQMSPNRIQPNAGHELAQVFSAAADVTWNGQCDFQGKLEHLVTGQQLFASDSFTAWGCPIEVKFYYLIDIIPNSMKSSFIHLLTRKLVCSSSKMEFHNYIPRDRIRIWHTVGMQ